MERELTTGEVGRLVGRSDETIRRYINAGKLPAQRRGSGRGHLYVRVSDARELAEKFNLHFDEELLAEYCQE